MDIFLTTRAKIPSGPGPYTSLIQTGGLKPILVQNRLTKPGYQRPGIQVVVRAMDPMIAMSKAIEWYNVMFAVNNRFIGSIWYQRMDIQQEPFDAGPDEQGRAKVVFNAIPIKRPA